MLRFKYFFIDLLYRSEEFSFAVMRRAWSLADAMSDGSLVRIER